MEDARMKKANSASRTDIYFLNFDGQVLTPGADDPVQNRSQLISQTVAIPTYLAGDPKRAAKIQSIIREVKAILAPYNIKIVTSRPQSGPYDMMVAGGSSRQAGLPAGIGAVAVIDCTAALPHHVSLLFDQTTGHEAARQIIGSLGISHGISASTKSTDCMCIVDVGSTPLAVACTLGGVNTPVSLSLNCEATGLTTMNVQQKFLMKFGKHP
jgi:hypothetical protein